MDNRFVDQGILDCFRSYAELKVLPKAEFLSGKDRSIYCSGLDYALANGVIEADSNASISHQLQEEILAQFNRKKLPFVWWTNTSLPEPFQLGGTLKGMILDIPEKVVVKTMPKELRVVKIKTHDEVKIFTRFVIDMFGMEPTLQSDLTKVNTAVMEQGSQHHYLVYKGDKVVAGGTLVTTPDSSGIWNFATDPNFRKQGIGSTLAHILIQKACDLGYRQVMAILTPKGLARGLLEKMGFKEVCDYTFYVHGISAQELEK